MTKHIEETARSEFGQRLYDGLAALPGSSRLSAEQLEVIYALAYTHTTQGQYEQALPLYAFLSQYGPTRKHYLTGLAFCLQRVGRHDDAIRIYSLIGTLYPPSIDAALRVAECLLAQEQIEEAHQQLALVVQAAEESGQHPDVLSRAKSLLALTSAGASA